jgi:hypothetical protein
LRATPHRDPVQRRQANAAAQRRRRARLRQAAGGTVTPLSAPSAPGRLSPEEILVVLADELTAIRTAVDVSAAERARSVAGLCSVALRAVETADLAAELRAMKAAVLPRRTA